MTTTKISINGAIHDWLVSIFSHQKTLNKNIEDYPKITTELDLEDADKTEVIDILTNNESARFEYDQLVYEETISAERVAKNKEDAKLSIQSLTRRINKAIHSDDKHREEIKIYLDHRQKEVEGLDLY